MVSMVAPVAGSARRGPGLQAHRGERAAADGHHDQVNLVARS
jgi:hypothetical protein